MSLSPTFQDQLSALSIPRLTTVLRVNLLLLEHASSFQRVNSLIETWWNQKAAPYGMHIDESTRDFTSGQGRFKVDLARTDTAFALAMEEPDSSVENREWICDFAMRLVSGRTEFAVRVSYRQPHNILKRPTPRAPRFLADVVDRVGAVDCRRMESEARAIDIDGLGFLKELIQAPQRTLPVIAVSEEALTRRIFTDPSKLARLLSGTAHVVRLDEGRHGS